MDYLEAVAIANANVLHDNYLQLSFGYSMKLVFPFKEGVAVLQNMKNVEQLSDSYSNPILENFRTDSLDVKIMSARTYKNHKVAALLGLTFDEVTALEKTSLEK